jgi:hypothetical protein
LDRPGFWLASCLKTLLSKIKAPYDPADLCASLIRYQRGTAGQASRDWGLSAELAALVEAPAIVVESVTSTIRR